MSEVNNKAESKAEKKRLRGRNSFDVINQIVGSFNASEGWALKRVNMIGMNIEVYLERSVDQAPQNEVVDNNGVVSNEKTKEAVVKASTTSEKSDEGTVVDEEDKPKARTTRSRTTKK